MIAPETKEDIEQSVGRRAERPCASWTRADVEELAAFNEALGNHSGAQAARELGSAETLCVMTGQQAGALTGPLYTLYKALGAIVLARQIQQHLSRRVVAGFWVVSDDHDFEEIATVTWLDKDGAPQQHRLGVCRRIACLPHENAQKPALFMGETPWKTESSDRLLDPGIETGALPAYAIPVTAAASALLAAIRESTHPTEWRDQILEDLEKAAAASDSFEDFFFRCLLLLLGGQSGLILVSPRLRCIRRAQSQILAREFSEPLQSTRLLREAGRTWEARGEKPPIHRHAEDVNCFLFEGAIRAHLSFRGGRFIASHPVGGATMSEYSPEQMRALLEATPERFSPNVATRPLVQDGRFPSIAYIAGPHEQIYLRQIEPLYEFFGVCRPAAVARPGAVLIESRVARALKKLGLGAQEFIQLGSSGALERLARKAASGWPAHVAQTASQTDAQIASLEQDLSGADSAVRDGASKVRGLVREAFKKLESRAIEAQLRDDHELTDRFRRVENSLAPLGQPQERVLSPFFPFYALARETLVPSLESHFAGEFSANHVISLAAAGEGQQGPQGQQEPQRTQGTQKHKG
ncbi:MAG: bacillithiol biosynthesis BshC [Candidatus Sumerlaeota bacterium]|nr:bacillithiol biosynthesis BshC [Candidatus Sumerlaeota bacterium]